MTIYNVNSQILKFCPRFLLDQRWKSLSLCPAAPFLDVSVWSSTGNTVRRCRCRRVGFETNSSSIAVRWRSGRWRNGGYTFPVRFPESKNSAGPTRGKWNATQWLPPRSHVSVLTMNVRGLTPTWAGNSSAQNTVAGYPFKHISIWRLVILVSTFLLLGGRHPPSMSSSPRASGSSFYLLRKLTRQNTWSS